MSEEKEPSSSQITVHIKYDWTKVDASLPLVSTHEEFKFNMPITLGDIFIAYRKLSSDAVDRTGLYQTRMGYSILGGREIRDITPFSTLINEDITLIASVKKDPIDRSLDEYEHEKEIIRLQGPLIQMTFHYTIPVDTHPRDAVNEKILVRNPSTLGEILQVYRDSYPRSYSSENEYWIDGEIIGLDTLPLTTEINTRKIIQGRFSTEPRRIHIGDALYAYETELFFPPCVNYLDDEPINSDPVVFNGDTSAQVNRMKNLRENMIILSYGDQSNQRIAYNKYDLLQWIRTCVDQGNDPIEPRGRRAISISAYVKIQSSEGKFEVIHAL